MIATEPCPICGKPCIVGNNAHLECVKAKLPPGVYLSEIRQQFDWTSTDGTIQMTFDVTAIQRAIATDAIEYERFITPVNRKFVETWIKPQIDNMAYVESLSISQILQPILLVQLEPGAIGDCDSLLIDGNHRYMAHYLRRWPDINCIGIRHPYWLPFAEIRGGTPAAERAEMRHALEDGE